MTNKAIVNSSTVLMENSNGQQANQQHQQTTTATATATTTTSTTAAQTTTTQQHSQQQQHIERLYYNPSRRKVTAVYENRASTYNMNRYQSKIIGKHNGCPWRPAGFVYPLGVLG